MRYFVTVAKEHSKYTKVHENINNLRKEGIGFFVAMIVVIRCAWMQLKISLDSFLLVFY
jgi:hypothetical protein